VSRSEPTELELLLASHLPPAVLGQALELLAEEHVVAYRIGAGEALQHLRNHLPPARV
jgi:hypothetical protein